MKPFQSLTLLVALYFASITSSVGAEFFRKQSGTTTIAAASTTRTVTITGVDMSQSFLVFSSTNSDASPTNYQVGGEITNSTTLSFERTGNTGTVTISWQVFEFEGGVYVQHGSTTNVTRGAAMNVTINCVDLTRSFVLISGRKSGTQLGADDGVTANLTSSTNMELQISNAGPGGANMEEAYWQVIEYQAASVSKITTTLAAGSATTTSTITPNITNLSKAFVISNHRQNGDVNPDDLPRTELTNVSTVTYTRVGTTADISIVTYVIEFTDQSSVVSGTQNFASTVTTQNVTIAAANSSCVIGSGNYGRQGSTDFAINDNTGHSWFTYEITTSTNLLISRATGTAGGNSSANVPWQIVTFEDLNVQQNTFYSIASGAWETNTSWSFTPDGSSGAVPTGVYPRRRNNVVIQTGHTITINNVSDNGPCGTSPDALGRSNVGPFAASNLTMFYQTGDILIRGTLTVTGIEMMTEGYTKIVSGGVFSLSSSYVNLGFLEADAGSTLSAADDIILAGSSSTIINTTSISNDDLIISFTNATLCGTGSTTLVNGSGSSLTYANGATVAQICTTFTVACTGVGCTGFPVTGTAPSSLGNTGPGGVASTDGTSELKVWLDASNSVFSDAGVTPSTNGGVVQQWSDRSGSTNNATKTISGQPTYVATDATINNAPSILFTRTNSQFMDLSSFTLDPAASSFSIISVLNAVDYTSQMNIIQQQNGTGTGRSLFYLDIVTTPPQKIGSFLGNAATLPTANYTYGTWSILSNTFNFVGPTTSINLYKAGTADGAASVTPEAATGNWRIGANKAGTVNFFNGSMSEMLILNQSLSNAKRIIIENYLSAKYAVTLAANNVYTMDDGAATFDHEVAGIGQASDGTNHKDARGTGVVRMWNPSGLANSEFLMWGHDNTALSSVNITVGLAGVDGTVIQERLSRIWRVGESADVGTVSISFDLSTIGFPLGSNLRLLIDRDGDGFGDNDVTPVAGSFLNNTIVFSGINFIDGDRFTLGNTDNSISLPIELVSFKGEVVENAIQLIWKTESERNNDFFTVERSVTGEIFSGVGKVNGKGTTNQMQTYSLIDTNPVYGTAYYRLKQTDFDGTFTFSKIIAVAYEGQVLLDVYPNPSNNGQVTIEVKGLKHTKSIPVVIYDHLGRERMKLLLDVDKKSGSAIKLLSGKDELPSGMYIVKAGPTKLLVKRFIVAEK